MTFAVDLPAGRTSLRPAIRLDGEWSYLADPRPQGQQATEETVDWTRHFPGRIAVPGCWQAQTGAAAARAFRFNSHRHRVWYRKRFVLPSEWAGRRISLRLGGVLPAAEVWLNGCALGMTLSSRCPVRADVTAQARPGEDNDLVICISRPELRLDGVFEWIVGGWEGVYRSVLLECHGPAWIRDVFVHGDAQAEAGAAWIGVAGRLPTRPPQCELRLTVYAGAEARPHWTAVCPLAGRGRDIRLAIPTGDLPRWSPESPALCRAVVEIHRGGSCLDQVSVRFGLRSLCVKGRRVLLNGQPVFLRGCGDNQCYPATVSPPNSVAFFRQRLSQMKSYGFNLVHAYDLFTEEHLQAADEVGMLVMQTLPFGVVNPVRAVRNAPGPEWRRFLRQELDNIVSSQRAHPALACFSMAGELYFPAQDRTSFRLFNQQLPARTRRLAPHTLVMDTNEGSITTLTTPLGRRDSDLDEPTYARDALRYTPPPKTQRPALAHEYAWWSSYPDIRKRRRYRGLPTEPYWFEEAAIAARRAGLTRELPRFVRNSRALQALLRKEGYEKARLYGFAGYIQWLFHDTLWAVEGIADDFGTPHNVSPQEMRAYNDGTVVLWDDRNRRTFAAESSVVFRFAVAADATAPPPGWRLEVAVRHAGKTWWSESLPVPSTGSAGIVRLRGLRMTLPALARPATADLEARLTCPRRGAITANRWQFWVFPHVPPFAPADGIRVVGTAGPALEQFLGAATAAGTGATTAERLRVACDRLNDEDLNFLSRGGRVLLLSDQALPYYQMADTDVFRTVPWNRGRTGHSGTVVERHRALADFPHEGFCDYAFVNLVIGGWPGERTWPFNLDAWRRVTPIRPIIRLIDHYRAARHKAYLFEARVGAGRLLATCLRIGWGIRHRTPESRRLLQALVNYARSDAFRPRAAVTVESLRQMLNGQRRYED